MPPTPSQIKELLLSAIDKDDNIVDMGSVTKAITLLESNPITKDALEETRLGKLVQIVRKKASSSLKKRCTALIKQWQSQFLPPCAVKPPRSESPAPSQVEAKGQEGSSTSDEQKPKPARQTTNATLVDKSKSENLRRRKRETETSPSVSPSSQGPPAKKLVVSQGVSPVLHKEGNGQDDSSLNGVPLRKDSKPGRTAIKDSPKTASPKTSVASPKNKPSISKDKGALKKLKQRERSASPNPKANDSAATNSLSTPSQLKVEKREEKLSPSVSKGKADRRVKISPGLGNVTLGRKRSLSYDPHPRLLDDSSTSNSLGFAGETSSTSVFDTDWDSTSLSFGGIGEDSSRSNTPHEESNAKSSIFDLDFSEAAESQVSLSSSHDAPLSHSPASLDEEVTHPSTSIFNAFSEESEIKTDVDFTSSPVEHQTTRERFLCKTETLEDEPVTPPPPVPEGDIDRIHDDEWEGVNGCYNDKGDWFDWMQCLTVNTDEENSIQILPYVCID